MIGLEATYLYFLSFAFHFCQLFFVSFSRVLSKVNKNLYVSSGALIGLYNGAMELVREIIYDFSCNMTLRGPLASIVKTMTFLQLLL